MMSSYDTEDTPAKTHRHRASDSRPFGSRLHRGVLTGLLVLVVAVVGFALASNAQTTVFHSCTVVSKNTNSSDYNQYFQWASSTHVSAKCGGSPEAQTFSVNDNPFTLELGAADIYQSIQVGKTYDFSTHGFNAPALGMVANISTATAR